jgi:hypothetical protein
MNADNTNSNDNEVINSEAVSLVEKVIMQFEVKKAKEKADAEILQSKLKKAETLEQYEQNYQSGVENTLKESEEFLGSKNALRTLSKLSDFDEVGMANVINSFKGKFPADQINDYVKNLAKQNDFNKYHKDKYQGANGLMKLAIDMAEDIKNSTGAAEINEPKEIEQQTQSVPKIKSNIQPEKVSSGENFVPREAKINSRANEVNSIKEANRILEKAGIFI